MTLVVRLLAVLVLATLATAGPRSAGAQGASATRRTAKFDVEKLAEGVYAVIRNDPPGLMFEANSAFIVGDADVIVVDGGSNPASAAEVLGALRALTSKPVRYVINTHWHGDHVTGNRVYQDAFPGVDFIAHTTSLTDLNAEGLVAQKGFVDNARRYADFLKDLMAKGKGLDGQALSAEERESHESSVALVEHALAAVPQAKHVPPTLTLDDRLTLHRGGRGLADERPTRAAPYRDAWG